MGSAVSLSLSLCLKTMKGQSERVIRGKTDEEGSGVGIGIDVGCGSRTEAMEDVEKAKSCEEIQF